MWPAEQRFSYRLEDLLRLRAIERDVLTAERAGAAREVERKAEELAQIERVIVLSERALRALCEAGSELSVDAQMRRLRFLDVQRKWSEEKQRELKTAEGKEAQIRAALSAKQREAKALERHKEKQRRQFDAEQARHAINDADDECLRARSRAPAASGAAKANRR